MPIYKVVPTTAFDVLNETSSVLHGKQYYFLLGDGSVYSRASCRNMTLEEAVEEFCDTLSCFMEGMYDA